MITPELVNYIQLRIAKGHHLDIIRKDLFAYGGWTHDDVDEVFKSVGVSEQDVPMASMESSVIKTGENKDEVISSQKPSYESKEVEQAPVVNVDLGGDVSVSSEKDHSPLVQKDIPETQEEMSTVLDLDNDSLEQAGIESVTQNTPDSLNEKQMNDVSLSSPTEEIAGISFENPVKEMPAEEPLQSVVEEKTPVVMPPVQPVDSFDPRIQPASIAVKETLAQQPVMQNTMQSSAYIPEPTIVPVGMVQEKESVPVMKTSESNIAPKSIDPVIAPKPAQNFAQEWYTKSEPVSPVVNPGASFNPPQASPAFGGMAITPDTEIHDDGVIIKKHNPVQKIIGITVIILLVLAIFGFGLYGYTQGLFSGFLNQETPVEETTVIEVPLAEQAFASLKNILPANSGMQFSYVGSITSEKDIFQSLFFPMNDEQGEVEITESSDVTTGQVAGEEIVTEDLNAEIPVIQPVESLLSVDGWLRNGDTGIQSEGNITLEIPRESGMERVRMKFILDQEFTYVSFGEASLEILTHLNIQKDIWYRLPVIHTIPEETPLPDSVQIIAGVVNTVSDGLQSIVLENPGVSHSVMNLPMYQYPMRIQSFGEMVTILETDFMRTVKNLTGLVSLRENTFIPYGFSGSSNFDTMSVQHTLQLTSLANNQIVSVIPEDVQILFPELKQSVSNDENVPTETETETEPLPVTEF
ncbi:MAG: hypothetical protein K9M36_00625 [Candidatus Pacebacteria bacterium]|nr:hypothetical protein [Candidatus Paceibacterota bacterium]